MYTIAPADDHTLVKQAHSSLLKARVVTDSPGRSATLLPSLDQPQSEDDLSSDGDLLVLRHEVPNAFPAQAVAVTQTTPWLLLPQTEQPDTSLVKVWRTTWSTAGQRPNIHHLLRSMGEMGRAAANSSGLVSIAVLALFRLWA